MRYLVKIGRHWLNTKGGEFAKRLGPEEYEVIEAGDSMLGLKKNATRFNLRSSAEAAAFNARLPTYEIVEVE